MLLGVINAKTVGDYIQKWLFRQSDTLRAVPRRYVKHCFVFAARHVRVEYGLGKLPVGRQRSGGNQPTLWHQCVQFHLHASCHDTARHINHMYGNAGHG